jgi:hypothetical protein
MQNLILQHANISTFLKHYLDRNINVDVQNIYRGLEPQKALMRLACSMSRSIDPRRPRKLTTEQSGSINDLPCIVNLVDRVEKYSDARKGSRREAKYWKARKRLLNEKQRQRRLLLEDVKDRFKKEQPVIDSERQLSGKVINEDTRDALMRTDQMGLEQLRLMDAILTLPETSVEAEYQRRIAAINAVTAYCGVEEGTPYRHVQRAQRTRDDNQIVKAEETAALASDMALRQAIVSIKKDKRPTRCFLCLGNPHLTIRERVASYATAGSLSRHFLRKHVKKLEELEQTYCWMCDIRLEHRKHLQIHAERFHGTVSRCTT